MSDPQDINGTYRIFYQGGALAGKKTNYPLTVEAPNNPDYEVWLVENLQERGHLIRQKSSPQMGLTYPSDVYPACPVLLDEQPRTVTIAPVGRADHFVIQPTSGTPGQLALVLSTAPAVDDAPKVSWQPNDHASFWRFEKIE